MKYFHRTSVPPEAVVERASSWFGARLGPADESPRQRAFSGSLGRVSVDVQAEGGHYTLVTVVTDQPGESELDKLAKRFLAEVHTLAHPRHEVRGAY